jgi:FdrA protein
MVIHGTIKKGEYYDSVTLMKAAKALNELSGVVDSAIIMGTKENKAILQASGMFLDEFTSSGDMDLIIAVKAESRDIADRALAEFDTVLKSIRRTDQSCAETLPHSMESAFQILPEANLVMISVAGRYAAHEAMKVLEKDMHVMLFSDNVPLEQEIELKRYACEHDLLVMGPDCGTAIINGVPLAFANRVNRGNIGIIAAAGTGLQEVSCLISNAGAGVSQAIGTGGRDVKQEVGGLMFLQALRLLAADEATRVILLVSKPPHESVLAKIISEVKSIHKPVIAVFLGADKEVVCKGGMIAAATLEEAAALAVAALHGEITAMDSKSESNELSTLAVAQRSRLQPTQKYLRGLFSGGTFCYEAQLLLQNRLAPIYSNAPTATSKRLSNSLFSQDHTIIDLGEDEFTVGRPHPMIDYTLRNKRIIEEAQDPATAVILLDVVLGFGSNPNPLDDLIPTIKAAQSLAQVHKRHLPIVCSVTGTDLDIQNRSKVVSGLESHGVIVMESNAAACWLAGSICRGKS